MQAGERHIKLGSEYDHLFPQPKGNNVTIKKKAFLSDTLNLMHQIIPDTLADTEGIAQELKAETTYQTCKNIWDFSFNHLQYRKDEEGKEQVRRPARVWRDRKQGVDCDCMSVFIGSILTHLDIPFSLRLTKNNTIAYEHVYPIAHTENGIIIMDAVVHSFNQEAPHTEKKDINMELQYLNGVEGISSTSNQEEYLEIDHLLENDFPIDAQLLLEEDLYELAGFKKWFNKTKSKVKKVVKKITPKGVKNTLKKGLHFINRANPVTGLLRLGVLASMKLNIMKVASKLRFAYWSDAEAERNNMQMGKFRQLKRIREKLEKIFYGAGGKPENLKKSILSGKGNRDRRIVLNGLGAIQFPLSDEDDLRTILGEDLYHDETYEIDQGINGLGVVATGASIATASGAIAIIAGLIAKLGDIFKKNTPQSEQQKIQENTENQEEKTRRFNIEKIKQMVQQLPLPRNPRTPFLQPQSVVPRTSTPPIQPQ
jgi:hypothetical protein